ncbi:LPF family protein, putative [Candida dubliniensis CD36]|uniref:LPF family protein, putative n=1 Tax=Candida dubliniensis (strain CD36 / ATCC MYA-646 / CBS 7987 / NCPF 3949 / NRRL Y-17841) TaxID=573826 RepID=B9WMY5_CANDC|nr:LPF family protein, putative [Candida dubliniensis CD36]CAX40451.1 LPF family protein, putative [Candida dubliniensis CD36]
MIITTEVELFSNLINLPNELIMRIISNIPRCMLPELLYFQLVRRLVILEIFSKVEITGFVERHSRSEYNLNFNYKPCNCKFFKITFDNLMKAIDLYSIYPKSLNFQYSNATRRVLDGSTQLLQQAQSISGTFNSITGLTPQELSDLLINSKIWFDSIVLIGFKIPFPLPLIATNVSLFRTSLHNYIIPGMRKLDLLLDIPIDTLRLLILPNELEELRIETANLILILPSRSLRKLTIITHSTMVCFISKEMTNLQYLSINMSNLVNIDDIGICAPFLQELHLIDCFSMTNFEFIKQYHHLKHLNIKNCLFPISLFETPWYPSNLISFNYDGNDRIRSSDGSSSSGGDGNSSPSLIFPPNLKQLSIRSSYYARNDIRNLVLPENLEKLELLNLNFINENFKFQGDCLQYVRIHAPTIIFDKNFQIPSTVLEFILEVEYLTFENIDFIYQLPKNLLCLHLVAKKHCHINPITEKIKWPLMLTNLFLLGFDIDQSMFELMNLKESSLEKITIRGGCLERLDGELLPVAVKHLTLSQMGIIDVMNLYKLTNLLSLSLLKNNLKDVVYVKLPLQSLQTLNVGFCNIQFLSSFLVSFNEEKFKNAILEVDAVGNFGVNIPDLLQTMQQINGLSVFLTQLNETTPPIYQRGLYFTNDHFDPFESEESSESDFDEDEMIDDEDDDEMIDDEEEDEDEMLHHQYGWRW